ncbi:MAG TPA: hypothetical protein VGS57_07870 [Thermoanaerobaculia bacterium]|jgi:hypothetical protein|nr:hypothetical protein [Thermoanaerobaculia bacterium]
MRTSTSCSCHSGPDPCAAGVIERPCYYPGQLLTPAELTLEQQYFRDKLRRHNRLLHGWGVVCGAAVCRLAEERAVRVRGVPAGNDVERSSPTAGNAAARRWKVRVTPGYVLGPYGDEIVIDREQVVDLRSCGQTGASGEHGEPPDPWCIDVHVQREPGPLYVAVRYQETKSRPVRAQPAGCGCDETQCEYSRCRDGYEICVLPDLPPSHEDPPKLDHLFEGPLPGCPPCPDDPWVVLARVEIDADGEILRLDNCSVRRQVLALGHLWWRCSGDACAIESIEVTDGDPVVGGTFTVHVKTAYAIPDQVEASLGDETEIKISELSVLGDHRALTFKAEVANAAKPGPRTLEIREKGGTSRVIAARGDAVVIRARETAPPLPAPPKPLPPSPTPQPPDGTAKPNERAPQSPKTAAPRAPRGKGKTEGK